MTTAVPGTNIDSLASLRSGWKDTIHGDGGKCPVCDRFGAVYDRKINESMAKALLWLYDRNTDLGVRTWIDVPNTAPASLLRTNQLSTLRWWGLVERQQPEPGSKTKHSGMWRITLKGADFVEGKLLVPLKVFTYAGEVVGFSDELTDYMSCHKVQFDIKDVIGVTHHTLKQELHQVVQTA